MIRGAPVLFTAWLALFLATSVPADQPAPSSASKIGGDNAAHGAAAPNVGDEAPVVLGVFPDADTSAVRPLKWSGRHTLLVFWSPEEKTSIRQLRDLRRLHGEFGSNPQFQIVSVATTLDRHRDEPLEWNTWIDLLGRQADIMHPNFGRQKFYLGWPHLFEAELLDPGNFPPDERGLTTTGRYGVTELPAAYLIGPDGRLSAARIPPDRLRETIAAALSPTK